MIFSTLERCSLVYGWDFLYHNNAIHLFDLKSINISEIERKKRVVLIPISMGKVAAAPREFQLISPSGSVDGEKDGGQRKGRICYRIFFTEKRGK